MMNQIVIVLVVFFLIGNIFRNSECIPWMVGGIIAALYGVSHPLAPELPFQSVIIQKRESYYETSLFRE